MKAYMILCCAAGVWVACNSASAQSTPLKLDEFQNSSLSLPPGVQPGTVGILEPGTPTEFRLSDALIFTGVSPIGGSASVQLLSDFNPNDPLEEIPPPPADKGLPGLIPTSPFVVEDALTGIATYTPLPGEPGFLPGATMSYVVLSDTEVPEPSTAAVLAVGGAATLLLRRQRAALA